MEAVLGALAADVVVVIEQRATAIPGMRLVAHNFDDDLPRISHATAVFCREIGLVKLPRDRGVCSTA